MDGKARLQCRLWWPRHLRFRPSCHTNLLLGWASGDSQSVDLVVATACSNAVISSDCFDPFLQVMLRCATNRLPSELQGRATFSVIGECFSPCSEQGSWNIRDSSISSGLITLDYGDKRPVDSCSWSQGEPGCSEVGNEHPYKGNRSRKNRADIDVTGLHRPRNGFPVCEDVKLEKSYKATMVSDTWIELLVQPAVLTKNLLDWIPHIHKLRVQGISCIPDFHLILYEQPKLASHHFSIRPWSYVSQASQVQEALMEPDSHLKKAEWVTELEKHRDAPNIDLVVLQLNCAVAAEQSIKHFMASLDTPCKGLSLSSILTPLYRHLIAATAALLATLFYIIVQAGSCLLKIWPFMLINALFAKLLKLTYRNIRIRCYELTGWPVILLWRGCGRDQPNIAAAHRTALVRHSTWSAIIFDLVFGILAGSFFLCYQSAINHYIRSMVRSLTDDILRTGCIWLMGVPAGFKLNTELAGILGLVSLNVIQVWSTLLYLLKPVFGPLLYMLAISGMLLGITVPAAMIADMLFLATIHISSLHQLVAFLYSNQLQALAALWRLFRGRKRNALRGRIDTYDYSVEQHVVGSLMFTPLLLLLPTTSVFYIFFTMLYTSLSIVRFSLQIFIAILHCFPYAQVAIWLAQPRRFPSGIWFENLPAEARFQQVAKQLSKGQGQSSGQRRGSSVPAATQRLITSLGIKTASIGEMLFPYMKQLGGGLTWSSCALCIYKIFSGERWPSSVELGAPVLPPWTTCTVRRFWWLCYDAVLASI